MNFRITILTGILLTVPSAPLIALPWATKVIAPQQKTSQEIIADAAKRLVHSTQTHRGPARTSLKTVQAVGLQHAKQTIKDLKPELQESYLDLLRTWAATHADLICDLTKILTGDVIDRGISKKGLAKHDVIAEAYVPTLAKLADKRGTKVSRDELVQTLLGTGIRSNLFMDGTTRTGAAAGHLATTLSFFEDGVLTNPRDWQTYVNVTKGFKALTGRGVETLVELLTTHALANKLDKQSHKTLVKVIARLCMESLNPVVEYALTTQEV